MYVYSTNVVVFNHKQNQMTFVVNIEVNWQGDVIKSFEPRNNSNSRRTGEPANFIAVLAPEFFFQAAPAPAPGFFPKQLRLRLLVFFFLAASAPAPALRGQKNGSGSRLLVKFDKTFSSPQTIKVKLQKYKTSKIIVYSIIKLTILP